MRTSNNGYHKMRFGTNGKALAWLRTARSKERRIFPKIHKWQLEDLTLKLYQRRYYEMNNLHFL